MPLQPKNFPLVLAVMLLVLAGYVNPQFSENDITLYFLSSSGNPVGNINVSLRDSANTTIQSNLTDNSTGGVIFYDVNSSNNQSFNFLSRYPSSQYSARISSISCDPSVLINDFGSVNIVLVNTLGEYLEAQDAQVYVTESENVNKIIKVYDTQCKTGEPFLDGDGNWASYSNCPFTNTVGEYNYVFPVLEKEGFYFNENYTVFVIANGIKTGCNFTTDIPRDIFGVPITKKDMDKRQETINQSAGILLIILIIIFIIYATWRYVKR